MKFERQLKRCLTYKKYASWNSSKDKKEEDKPLQDKSSKPSSSYSKEYKHFSSPSKDSKHSSSSEDHVSFSSSLKPKFEEKTSSMNALNVWDMDIKL